MEEKMKKLIFNNIVKLPPNMSIFIYVMINTIIKPKYLFTNIKSLLIFKQNSPKLYQKSKKALRSYCFTETNSDLFKIYLESYSKQLVKSIQVNNQRKTSHNKPILVCA